MPPSSILFKYRTPDFGRWGRGTRHNDGSPELSASSVGAVKVRDLTSLYYRVCSQNNSKNTYRNDIEWLKFNPHNSCFICCEWFKFIWSFGCVVERCVFRYRCLLSKSKNFISTFTQRVELEMDRRCSHSRLGSY